MGVDWSWPCGDREKVKYKTSILTSKAIQKSDMLHQIKICTVQVITTTTTSLNRELKRPNIDYLPVSVCNHPTSIKDSLIIYQKHSNLRLLNNTTGYAYSSEFSFTGKNIEDSKVMLESDLSNSLDSGQVFLGIVGSIESYYLVFFKPNIVNPLHGQIKIFYIEEVTRRFLELFLSESLMLYKGFVYRKGKSLIIMEDSITDSVKYMVIEFSEQQIESMNIENIIAETIEEFQDRNIEFQGTLGFKSKMFLIFIIRV